MRSEENGREWIDRESEIKTNENYREAETRV